MAKVPRVDVYDLSGMGRYFSSFMENGTSAAPWVFHDESEDDGLEFFRSNKLLSIDAGSIILASRYSLQEPTRPNMGQNLLLDSTRLWQLLNASQPLIIFLHNDEQCNLPWPSTTHHMLYRDTWSADFHHEWIASHQIEDQHQSNKRSSTGRTMTPSHEHWPWLRSFPYGTAFDGGDLSNLAAERRPVDSRRLLFSFRGSISFKKPYRRELRDFATRRKEELDLLAGKALKGRDQHPSGLGRFATRPDRAAT